jgi:hypothetical protein
MLSVFIDICYYILICYSLSVCVHAAIQGTILNNITSQILLSFLTIRFNGYNANILSPLNKIIYYTFVSYIMNICRLVGIIIILIIINTTAVISVLSFSSLLQFYNNPNIYNLIIIGICNVLLFTALNITFKYLRKCFDIVSNPISFKTKTFYTTNYKRQLKKWEINNFSELKSMEFTKKIQENKFNEECPICMELNATIIWKCFHTFCLECDKLEKKNTCPVCRMPSDLIKVIVK